MLQKVLSCISILLFLIQLIKTESDYYSSYTEHRNTTFEINSDNNYEEYEILDDKCTVKQLIINYNVTHFLPSDYEKTKTFNITRNVANINETINRFKRLLSMAENLQNNKELRDSVAAVASQLYDTAYDANLSPQCMADIIRIFDGIRNRQLWAVKFIDSLGSLFPSGITEGNVWRLGEYDQCLDIESDEQPVIYGQYCQLKVVLPLPKVQDYKSSDETLANSNEYPFIFSFANRLRLNKYIELNPILKMIEYFDMTNGTGEMVRLGLCIPQKCGAQEIEQLVNKIQYPITQIPVEINPAVCAVKHRVTNFDNFQKFSIAIILVFIGVAVLSTIYEIVVKYLPGICGQTVGTTKTDAKTPSKFRKALIAFSILSNSKFLFEKSARFASVYAITAVTTFIIFALHFHFFFILINPKKRYEHSITVHLLHYKRYFWLRTPALYFDSLFVIGGLMLTYSVLKTEEKKRKSFTYINYVCQRWIKVSISMTAVLLLIYLLPLTGDGPNWYECVNFTQHSCRDKWLLLSSYLFYSNWNFKLNDYYFLFPYFPICNITTWYLSASFQLYVLAPILFLSLLKKPKFGLPLTVVTILLGIFLNVSPKFLLNNYTYYDFNNIASIRDGMMYISNYLFNPVQYVCSFSIGILTGYMIHSKPLCYVGGPIGEIILWFLALITIPLIYIWNITFWNSDHASPEWSILLWFGFGKFLWSASLAWIMFMCCTGRAGFMNAIMTAISFQPIAKLSHIIYLVQILPIFHRIYTMRQMDYVSEITIEGIVFDFSIAVLLAYIVFIIFEKPITNLINLF